MGCRYTYWETYRRWYRDSGIGLYRDPANGRVAGVCAGLAAALRVRPGIIRLGWIVAALFAGPFAVLAYIAATLALPPLDDREPPMPRWAAAFDPERHLFTRGRDRRAEWRNPPREGPKRDQTAPGNRYRRPSHSDSLDSLKERLRGVDRRVATVEAYVASSEFTLSREIRNLER
jgi:phage shock protein C